MKSTNFFHRKAEIYIIFLNKSPHPIDKYGATELNWKTPSSPWIQSEYQYWFCFLSWRSCDNTVLKFISWPWPWREVTFFQTKIGVANKHVCLYLIVIAVYNRGTNLGQSQTRCFSRGLRWSSQQHTSIHKLSYFYNTTGS